MSKTKYKIGNKVRTIAEFEEYAECGDLWFKVEFGKTLKTVHYGFLCSWQYRTLLNFIKRGAVYTAVPVEEEPSETYYSIKYNPDGSWSSLLIRKQ